LSFCLKVFGIAIGFLTLGPWYQAPNQADPVSQLEQAYARIHIGDLDAGQINALKSAGGIAWWVEADRDLLVLGARRALQRLSQAFNVEVLDVPVDETRLRVVRMDHFRGLHMLDAWILLEAGRMTVVQARGPLPSTIFHDQDSHPLVHVPLKPNTVLAREWRPPAGKRRLGPDPLIQSLVNQVDPVGWLTDIYCLATYNRYTRGTEIREAEAWLVERFEALPGLSVRTESFFVNSDEAFNVIAELPGDGSTDDIFIVGAHYDAISENSNLTAPGAEDNASGTAAVLEIARIFSKNPPPARVIFACYSGEEQGLHGSRDQVNRLIASNELSDVKAVLIMDMIGYSADTDLDTLLETSETWSDLSATFAEAGTTYTNLRIVTSFNPFGSDHIPFIQNQTAALLVIENDWNIYPGYHRSSDTPNQISISQGHENLNLTVATMATLFGFGFEGNYADYLEDWLKEPHPPTTMDLTGNMKVDVGELVLVVNHGQ